MNGEEISALIARLRTQAHGASEVSKMMAEAKSRRQGDGSRSDLYMWSAPEQTLEWKAADALEAALSPPPEGVRPDYDSVVNQTIRMIMPSLQAAHEALAHLAKTIPDCVPGQLPLAACYAATEASRLAAAIMLLTPTSWVLADPAMPQAEAEAQGLA
jgi:hypothetical protein